MMKLKVGKRYQIEAFGKDTHFGIVRDTGSILYFDCFECGHFKASEVRVIREVESEPEIDKASRFNDGKPQLSYMLDAPVAMQGLSEVFAMGAEKYSRDNWKKGLDKDQIIDSLLRHLIAYKNGEAADAEFGKCHTFHVMWNALVLAEQHSNK